MTTCEASVDWDNQEPMCGKPAVVMLVNGCVHEHVSAPWAVCAGCLKFIEDAREWICIRCKQAGHHCPVVFTRQPA